MSIKKIRWYLGQKFLVSSFINAVLRVFLIFNMAAEGERENIVAHSRITWLICARRVQIYLILFKMAAKLKSERTWVRDLETRKKNPTCTSFCERMACSTNCTMAYAEGVVWKQEWLILVLDFVDNLIVDQMILSFLTKNVKLWRHKGWRQKMD